MINLPVISIPKINIGADSSKFLKLGAPAAAIAVSVLVLLFVIWPTFNSMIKLNISNKQLATRASSLEAKSQDLATLDRNKLDRELTASEQLLPSDKGVFLIVQQIERAASSSGVILNRIDVAPGSIGDSVSTGQGSAQGAASAQTSAPGQNAADLGSAVIDTPKVQLRVAITSDYAGFLKFLNTLISLPRVVSIHDLTLSTAGGTGGSSSALRTALTLDAYWKPLPKELPAVETAISKLTPEEENIIDNVVTTSLTNSTSSGSGGTSTSIPSTPSAPSGRSDLFAPF